VNATMSRMTKLTTAVARNNSLQQRTIQLGLHVTLGAFVIALLLGLCAPKLSASVCTGLPTEAQLKNPPSQRCLWYRNKPAVRSRDRGGRAFRR